MKIYLSSDHGGFAFKEALKRHFQEKGLPVVDVGNLVNDPDDDYPDFIIPMAEQVAADPGSLGIVLGRSGNGEAIAANKVKGVRCALCTNVEMACKARQHNDANVLSLGGDYVSSKQALEIADAFLYTPFSRDERHRRRLEKISRYESA